MVRPMMSPVYPHSFSHEDETVGASRPWTARVTKNNRSTAHHDHIERKAPTKGDRSEEHEHSTKLEFINGKCCKNSLVSEIRRGERLRVSC